MSLSCPPDTDQKRLVRFYLYRRIKMLWQKIGLPLEGSTFVLSGDEASEIGCLRYYLELLAPNVHFVDLRKEAVEAAKKSWPEVRATQKPIADAIAACETPIILANLDFCGYLADDVIESILAAVDKIAIYGVVAYTYVRDRESAYTPHWESVKKMAIHALDTDPRYKDLAKRSPDWLDMLRFIGYTEFLRAQLGPQFELVFRIKYHSSRNMGVIALQNVPKHCRTPAWRKELITYRSHEERVGQVFDVDMKSRLREIAMKLTDSLPAKQVAEILHLPTGTLAAWQAHKTRGTYNRPVVGEGGGEEG